MPRADTDGNACALRERWCPTLQGMVAVHVIAALPAWCRLGCGVPGRQPILGNCPEGNGGPLATPTPQQVFPRVCGVNVAASAVPVGNASPAVKGGGPLQAPPFESNSEETDRWGPNRSAPRCQRLAALQLGGGVNTGVSVGNTGTPYTSLWIAAGPDIRSHSCQAHPKRP